MTDPEDQRLSDAPGSIQYSPPIVAGSDFNDGVDTYVWSNLFLVVVVFITNFWVYINPIASLLVCIVACAFYAVALRSLKRKILIYGGTIVIGMLASLAFEIQRTSTHPEKTCPTFSPTPAQSNSPTLATRSPTVNGTRNVTFAS